jgi:PAS domain S-box-containing protein
MSSRDRSTDHDTVDTAASPWSDLLRARWVRAVLIVELVIAAAVALGLWTLRRQTLDSELRMLASLSAAMAEQADATLAVADAALRATRDELVEGLLVPGTQTADALLRARAAALPTFRALTIFDAQGLPVATSREESASHATVVERDFFVIPRDHPAATPFIGSPYVSRSDGRAAIGVSMDWRDTGGDLKGVIALVADPEFLDGGFERIAPTPDTSLAIYRRDRELVSDGPGDGSARLLPSSAMNLIWADAAPEVPRLMTLPDGRQRLVAAHPLQQHPLMMVVTRDAQAALADWTQQSWLAGSFAASALVVTLLLTLRYGREQSLRHASEAALAAEQARAMRAFQAAREGYWEWNPVTGQAHMSPRMKELLGLARDESLTGETSLLDRGTVHPDDVAPLRAAFVAHQEGRSRAFDFTFRVRHVDGRWHHVRARGQTWRNTSGKAALFSGTASDVTAEVEAQAHQRQLETRLERSRKLEALGTLAGGVAHDFNNILAAIVGYGELARSSATQGSKLARRLDQILQAGQRGKALVERILSFSGGKPRPHAAVLLQPIVDEVLQLLRASLPPQIRLDRQLNAPAAAINGDATMILEAVMNLCTNAVQAMPDGGTLTVGLDSVSPAEPLPLFETSLAPGRYVRLAVADTGSGITPAVMVRLFEPFFTTKGPQKGTGLGLAVVHGVMADLGGAIDVHSTPGRGSRFELYFPSVDDAPAVIPAVGDETPLGEGQTVLYVDDEPALVELAQEMLAGLGYEPFGIASSVEALARFKEDPGRFDLVITDEVMPDMIGTALAAALHAVRPDLPIVLASGFGGPQLEERARAAGVTVQVSKPLMRAELARAVAQALRSTVHASTS